ncbi:MAG TPA: CDP-alcohol phosphatidyltransferase family protein [Polyangiaceae bacterium]
MALSNDPMEGWLLVIDPPVGTWALDEPLLGLNVVLRLALTAQAAGARAVALADGPETSALRARLEDARLRIRVIDEMDRPSLLEFRPTTPSIRVPANVVVHRATLQALAEKGRQVELTLFGPDASSEPAWKAVQGAAGSFGFDPIVVTDRASAKVAREALLRSLRKTHDGWASTHLNRRISLSLTRWLVETPLRPNQVSVGILGVGLLGAWLASRGTYGALLAGAALFQAQSVLDGCDGEMSRLTFRGSRTGEWLDTIGDDLTNYGFFAGAAWGLYTMSGRALYLVLGAVTVMCGIVGSGLEYRYLIRVGSGDLLKYPLGIGKAPGGQSGPSEPPGGLRRLVDAISPLFKRDTFVLLTLVGAAIGWLGPFLALFAAGAVGVLFAVIGAEVRMARDRSTKAESSRQVDPVGSGD